jgi:hypothetical protein
MLLIVVCKEIALLSNLGLLSYRVINGIVDATINEGMLIDES